MQDATLAEQIRATAWKRAAFVVGVWLVAAWWVYDLLWRLPAWLSTRAEYRPLTWADAGTLDGWLAAFNRFANGPFGRDWQVRESFARLATVAVCWLAVRFLDGGRGREVFRGMGLRSPGRRGLLFLAIVCAPLLSFSNVSLLPRQVDGGGLFGLMLAQSGEGARELLPALALTTLLTTIVWVGFLFHQLHLRCGLRFVASVAIVCCLTDVWPLLRFQLDVGSAIPLSRYLEQLAWGAGFTLATCWLYVRWNANLWIVAALLTTYWAWRSAPPSAGPLGAAATPAWWTGVGVLALAVGVALTLAWGRRARPAPLAP